MRGERHPQALKLKAARERTLERLSEGFVKDELGLDAFESRIDAAYRAADEAELQSLIDDLDPHFRVADAIVVASVVETASLVHLGHAASAPNRALATRAAPTRTIAVLGNTERRGQYRVDDGARVLAVLGNVELDLRDVVFPPGVTRLYAKAVFGNVEITVPPTLAVECEGSGFLGNFSTVSRVPPEGDDTPVLRVIGVAVFGNVEVLTRPRAHAAPSAIVTARQSTSHK